MVYWLLLAREYCSLFQILSSAAFAHLPSNWLSSLLTGTQCQSHGVGSGKLFCFFFAISQKIRTHFNRTFSTVFSFVFPFVFVVFSFQLFYHSSLYLLSVFLFHSFSHLFTRARSISVEWWTRLISRLRRSRNSKQWQQRRLFEQLANFPTHCRPHWLLNKSLDTVQIKEKEKRNQH